MDCSKFLLAGGGAKNIYTTVDGTNLVADVIGITPSHFYNINGTIHGLNSSGSVIYTRR